MTLGKNNLNVKLNPNSTIEFHTQNPVNGLFLFGSSLLVLPYTFVIVFLWFCCRRLAVTGAGNRFSFLILGQWIKNLKAELGLLYVAKVTGLF
ncbi:uncharacterized protein DS421_13g401490 [Arachis hypogaea]|nr:uncharacterized protein DS421_13g401490 [Arachis hypogaea]